MQRRRQCNYRAVLWVTLQRLETIRIMYPLPAGIGLALTQSFEFFILHLLSELGCPDRLADVLLY
jgi:hypothetical protein